MTSKLRRIPLSSVASVPLSEPTRQKLIEKGVPESDLFRKTELWGQSILAVKMPVAKKPTRNAPSCYRREFDPKSDLCAGCAWMATCWRSCRSYLDQMPGAGYPPGVPRSLVDARLKKLGKRSLPPRKKRKPPPRRKK